MSELVSSLGLSFFPIVGLVAFGIAFLFVLARVARTGRSESAAHAAIPLADGTEHTARGTRRPTDSIINRTATDGGDA